MKKMKKKKKRMNDIFEKIKSFLNKPAPIIIVLIGIVGMMLLFITNYVKKNMIFVGTIESNKLFVSNIHCFTNGDMNYFYATPAAYNGDEEVYSFQIGYYVTNEKGEYIEFATRSKNLENSSSLSQIVSEQTGWDFAEADSQSYLFNEEIIENFKNLHLVIKASTEKDNQQADIIIDEKVEVSKITK